MATLPFLGFQKAESFGVYVVDKSGDGTPFFCPSVAPAFVTEYGWSRHATLEVLRQPSYMFVL